MMKRFIFKLLLLTSFYIFNNASFGVNYYSSFDFVNTTFTFKDSGNYAFNAGGVYNYNPTNLTNSSPMIKIVASDFLLNANNIGVFNLNNVASGFIGIEIGWSPAELAADPSRVQPKNINISNLSLHNFDVGIVIHEGVSLVNLENVNIFDGNVGVACLGTSTGNIENVNLSNINIIGREANCYSCLVAIKNNIEVTYGYGTDYFMKLIADPNNGNSLDVYPYYGIWCNNVSSLEMDNVAIKEIGYDYVKLGTAGNGARTQAIGITLKNSYHVVMNHAILNDIYGEINAIGVLLDNISSITISNSDFSYTNAGQLAVGIQVTNQTSADYSVTALTLENINSRNNISENIAKGMDLSSVHGLLGINLSSKFNKGAYQSYGLYIDTASTVNINGSTFSENIATRTINDVITTPGIVAYGFYGNNINGMQILNTDFNNMQALNSAYGVFLNNSSSVLFTDSQFVANTATQMRSGEATDIRTQQDAQEISKHAPVVDAASTGAYGVFVTGSKYIKFEGCLSNSNTGHRAIGLKFINCRAVAIYDTFVSTQYATGTMLDSSFATDNTANPSAIPVKAAHLPLLFGGLSVTSVDALTTTDLFLEKMSSIRATQLAGNTPAYTDLVAVTATSSLLESMIARYRIWGVAMGIHAHNVSGFVLNNCTCVGNISLFDSAVGIGFTGRNTDHTVRDSSLSFNAGNYASLITAATNPSSQYAYSYNLMGTKSFWSTLLQTDVWTNITNNFVSSSVNSVALSPNGNYLAVGMSDNNIVILNPKTGATITTLTGHTGSISSVAFSPDGTKLATASLTATNNIKIWETTGWTNTQTLTHTSTGVNVVVWNPAGTQLSSGATVSTNNFIVWQVSGWSTVTSQTHSSVGVLAIAYNPAGTLVATASNDTTNNIKTWETTGWTNTHTLSGASVAVTSLAFNPAATLLASGSQDNTIKIWETTGWTNTQIISPSAGTVNAVAFKNDGTLLASAHGNNSVHVWSTTNWSSVTTFTDHIQAATSLAWSADGRRIVSGGLDGYAKYYSTNIFSKATTTTDIGIYNPSIYFTVQGQKAYGNESVGNNVFVRLKSQDRALISPVGPVGAGIVMGDLLLEGVVQNSNLYGNVGNAGNSIGVLLDNAYSVTLDSNLVAGNIANIYGTSVGIQDRTAHSPNLFMKNFLEGNKCSTFNNSNYFIPFNPADTNNLSFPLVSMLNGKFNNITTLFDNIEVKYSQNSEFYNIEYLSSTPQHPDLLNYLTGQNCLA